jgi:predicted lysophospholipase L1 biosynthesis ABC-type transport system permease subunit
MLKNLQNNIVLWLQAKTGLSVGFVISLAVVGSAVLVMFVFLCVTGYVWASIQLGPVFGGLAMAGVFLLTAIVGAAASAIARARARQRAMMERAARPQGIGALIDPKALSVAKKAARALGWQRLVPLALLGFLAAQWAKEARRSADTPDRTA